jgi:hypothetical protein
VDHALEGGNVTDIARAALLAVLPELERRISTAVSFALDHAAVSLARVEFRRIAEEVKGT